MKKKYIINNGRFIFGTVRNHWELLRDHSQTTGGGWWHYDHETDTTYLYSHSTEFGSVKEQQARAALEFSPDLSRVAWSNEPTLEMALENNIIIKEPGAEILEPSAR